MQIKILFSGEGVTIPGIQMGLSFAFFKIWTGPPFRGFTTASNQALLGFSIIETQVVELGELGEPRESLFRNLHARTLFAKIEPTIFFHTGGTATVTLTVKEQQGGNLIDRTVQFVASDCRGISATAGVIEFKADILMLPSEENDPFGSVIP